MKWYLSVEHRGLLGGSRSWCQESQAALLPRALATAGAATSALPGDSRNVGVCEFQPSLPEHVQL